MSTSERRTTLRLPEEMQERVKALADRERRSIHAQLLTLIERGLADETTQQALRSTP
jgi:predicted DNA-binding protein